VNEKRAGLFLRQIEHIRGHLWHIYSLTVNQVVCGFLKPLGKSNSLIQNVLPGTITEQATCSNPHNDWCSLSVTFPHFGYSFIINKDLLCFSCDSRVSCFTVSNSIHKNVKQVIGHSFFLGPLECLFLCILIRHIQFILCCLFCW
jgi:hypothetical protein